MSNSNENIDFKKLWQQQTSDQPNPVKIMEKLRKYKRKNLRNIIITNVTLILTSAFIAFIWYYYQPQMITTKVGIVITIAAMAIFLIVSNQTIPLLRQHYDLSSRDYLQELLTLKKKQHFQQETMMNIYFIMLSLGIALYLIEYAMRMPLMGQIATYGISLGWIAFNWFYLRPKKIQKQRQKMDEIIGDMRRVSQQLES